MTEAPIPMDAASAAITASAYVARCRAGSTRPPTERELRAIEVQGRLAQRQRAASVSHTDSLTQLVGILERLRDLVTLLERAISTATTSPDVPAAE